MARVDLRDRIRSGLFILDGAMGTQLAARGIESGKCNDYQNIESPDIVLAIHQAYIAAGSDAVITNTLGGTSYALARHGHHGDVEAINKAGALVARKAAGEDRYVLGDIGPCGDFLEPLGLVKADELKEAFVVQAKALADGGVDGFIIETMSADNEVEVAIEAAKSVGNLPVFASMSFDSAGGVFRTMMGVDVKTAVAKILSLGVDAVGFNCGKMSFGDYIELTAEIASAVKASGDDIPVIAEPNAGLPELVDYKAVYNVSGEDFAKAVKKIHAAGATIIGGCCGTSPEHIKALATELKSD